MRQPSPVAQLVAAIIQHAMSHQTDGHDWPDDAEYCVVYCVKAWPTDYDRNTAFFNDVDEMREWYAKKCEWARYDGNDFYIEYVQVWDLGPQYISDELEFLRRAS